MVEECHLAPISGLYSANRNAMRLLRRISPVKSASLRRLIAHYWGVSRYLSGETSHNGTSGPAFRFTSVLTSEEKRM